MNHNSKTDVPRLPGRQGALSRLWVTPGSRNWLDVTFRQFYINGLSPDFDGYRIVQFSDLHFDGVMITRARLEQLVACINDQQPDLIAFTGDFVTHRAPFREDDLTPLRDLRGRDAVVAVAGNHDRTKKTEAAVERIVVASGMTDLNNSVHTIRRGDEMLHIAGVDSLKRHRARLDFVLAKLPDTGTAILLAHEPDFADVSASTRRFALQLSGHTHGGQIRIPMLVDRMLLYINRGIGTTGVSLRVNCPPELSVITLKAWNTAKQRDERSGNTTEPAS